LTPVARRVRGWSLDQFAATRYARRRLVMTSTTAATSKHHCVFLPLYRASAAENEMYGLRIRPVSDSDLQVFLHPRTDSGTLVDENLPARTDADPVILDECVIF